MERIVPCGTDKEQIDTGYCYQRAKAAAMEMIFGGAKEMKFYCPYHGYRTWKRDSDKRRVVYGHTGFAENWATTPLCPEDALRLRPSRLL